MSLFPTVLYPTDFSTCAEAAHPLAFEMARHGEAFHVLYVDHLFDSAKHVRTIRERLSALKDEAPVPGTSALARDIAPAAAILRYAQTHEVDLIVMGTHGRRGLSRLLLGSTAREVVQLAPCPVLTVRHDIDSTAFPPLRGRSILVAVDFSETSREALRTAVRLADAFEASIDLVHVIQDLFEPVDGYTLRSVFEVDPNIEARQKEALLVFREEVASDFERFGAVKVVTGDPEQKIADMAAQLDSGLLVLGTRGLHGLEHLVMGSVAEAVVRIAPCPVLSVKTADAAAAARAEEFHERKADNETPYDVIPSIAF